MTDDEILALANAVSDAMRALTNAQEKFQTDSDEYTAQYAEWDARRAVMAEAQKALVAAKAALDAGLATR